jgi:hypothetical protein
MGEVTNYETGATRDSRDDKPVFDKFLSHEVLRSYAAYMHGERVQSDGKLRTGDNWKHGIPVNDYMESLFRHFMDVWELHNSDNPKALEKALNGVLFNAMGMQYENLKQIREARAVEQLNADDFVCVTLPDGVTLPPGVTYPFTGKPGQIVHFKDGEWTVEDGFE